MRHLFRFGFTASTTLLFIVAMSAAHAVYGQLIISEFRVRGPNGANDEFIEIYNNSGADHTVAGGGTGYGVAASNGVARCVIPNGTVIPNRGHYLCVNSVGYSLASYPAGNGITATGDATYTTDIPDNAGIAMFNTSVAGNFVLANRLDAVGSTSEANTLYKEGTGYPALTPFSIDYSFYRKIGGTCTNSPNNCDHVASSFPLSGMHHRIRRGAKRTTCAKLVWRNGPHWLRFAGRNRWVCPTKTIPGHTRDCKSALSPCLTEER